MPFWTKCFFVGRLAILTQGMIVKKITIFVLTIVSLANMAFAEIDKRDKKFIFLAHSIKKDGCPLEESGIAYLKKNKFPYVEYPGEIILETNTYGEKEIHCEVSVKASEFNSKYKFCASSGSSRGGRTVLQTGHVPGFSCDLSQSREGDYVFEIQGVEFDRCHWICEKK